MKEGWTYKKLGEVCEYAKTRINSRDISIENYIGVDNLLQNCQGRSLASKIPDELGLSEYWEGDVLVGNIRPYLKKIWLADCRGGCNGDVLAIRRKHEYTSIIDTSFLFKCLSTNYFFDFAMQYAKGEKMPRGDKKEILKYLIPIPPIAEQERIVAELDLLSGIIEKKKEQLKAYNQLAQSIFYTMFGDPIDNPNGWEVKKLGEVCSLKAGKAIKAAELKEKQDNLYPCYGGNGIRGFIDKVSHKEDFPIIGRQGALCGNVNFARGPFYATEHAVVVTPLIEMNMIWLFYELKCSNLEQYAHGVAQPGIAVNDLNPIHFPLPPLSLQQEFAEKIEAIERQKALVQQSIDETQTMFDYSMDKYFG